MDFVKKRQKKPRELTRISILILENQQKWSKKIKKTSGFCRNSVLIIKKTLGRRNPKCF
jgi:hypothetical protein